MKKGYKPEHFELEPKWKVGHGASGGRADILIKDNSNTAFLIIECKTYGEEFDKEWKAMLEDGGQLFSYAHQVQSTQYICLYASDYNGKKTKYVSRIVTLNDNDEYLKSLSNPLSYKKATNDVKLLFQTWSKTYKNEYESQGIFEDEIGAYEIGRKKYSVNDLIIVDSDDIQKKYHEFATILRQHNVSGRENAFDKLVNLFLAKIVDEIEHPDELRFYWKGVAFDDYYSLQDRIQKLYKDGMQKFLEEDVTYIDNNAINDAFRLFRSDPDATKETILNYFRQLKFYTNNDFAFLDVHNEHLFYQNSVILLKIVKMLQDIRLKTEEQNQFLGDLFEGFLDQGIKQSEGQFFTPTPIVKFIVASLPLEQIIKNSNVPKVIDYACGAGHFLTEYATQIQQFVNKEYLPEYYAQIIGIEKEYRLSKVSKVSAFMYGQDEIKIIYGDALAENNEIKDGTYSVLIANPPYSVRGFLETLSVEERNRFEILKVVDGKNISSNNAIETFFVERAKQLLAPGGIAAIILPSSVLSNKNAVYVKAREILLQYFDFVAIVELGRGTFGKTGTNTVTLFLRRKAEKPSLACHYKNRVESWFNGDFEKDKIFEDQELVKQYCLRVGYEYKDYLTLMIGNSSKQLLQNSLFEDYLVAFNELITTKNKKKQKTFLKLSEKERYIELEKDFVRYVKGVEKDKLYYYMLARTNPQAVVVIKSPSSTSEIKKFLGYEWSGAKGDEGIKYLGVTTNDDENTISKNKGIKRINTPLFNPNNLFDETKINTIIRKAFLGEEQNIESSIKLYELDSMLDFSGTSFDKTISLTENAGIIIVESKYPLDKLRNLSVLCKRGKSPVYGNSNIQVIKSGQARGVFEFDFAEKYYLSDDSKLDDRKLQKGDILINSTGVGTVGRVTLFELDGDFVADNHITILRVNEKVLSKYILYMLCYIGFDKLAALARGISGQIELSLPIIEKIEIPVPPITIQQMIINECWSVDEEYKHTDRKIEEYRQRIQDLFNEIEMTYGEDSYRLSEIAQCNPSKSEIADISDDLMVSFIEMASVNNTGEIEKMVDRPLRDVRKGSYTYFKEDDIIIAKITPCMENGKCAIARGLTNGIAMGSSEFHVFRCNHKIKPDFLFDFLNRDSIRLAAQEHMTGASGHRRVPIDFYKQLRIPKISADEQETVISKIKKYKREIESAKESLFKLEKQKNAIIEKYLR